MEVGALRGHFAVMQTSAFVERLRQVIDQSEGRLTPAGLATMAGLDNSAIRSLLSGKAKNPRWDTIEKICAALGTTPLEFMSEARTAEEREIVRLAAQLPAPLLRQLIGYGQALYDAQAAPPEDTPEGD